MEEILGHVGQKINLTVQQRDFQPLPLAGLLPRDVGGQNSMDGQSALRTRSPRGIPARTGHASRLPGNGHAAAHRLDYEIVARPIAVRTGIAEGGNRTADNLGVVKFQILVVDLQPLQDSGAVIIIDHVRMGDQFVQDRPSLRAI